MAYIPIQSIQPLMWASEQKGGPCSPMVCCACPDWQGCAARRRCVRATDEDYMQGMPVKESHVTVGLVTDAELTEDGWLVLEMRISDPRVADLLGVPAPAIIEATLPARPQ